MKLGYKHPKPVKLYLVPFMDLLTALLTFLLICFSPEEAKLKKSREVMLPASAKAFMEKVPHLQVEVGKDYVKLNTQIVPGLIPDSSDEAGWKSLEAMINKVNDAEKARGNQKAEEVPVFLMADKTTEFKFIDRMSAHLAVMGHPSIFFVTQQKQKQVASAQEKVK